MRPLLLALLLATPAHADRKDDKVEMATYGAIYGLSLGVWTSVETDVNLRPAAWITAATTTGGVFGGLQLVDSLELSTGQVRLTASAAAWTAFDWLLLAAELDADGEAALWTAFGLAAAAGGGALIAANQGFDPSPGDMALVNSGGIWMVPAGLLFGFTFHLGSGKHIFRDILVLNVLGLGTGIGLANVYDPSREQVLYLDAGILAGGVAGGLLGLMLAVGTDSFEGFTGLTFLGMAAGGWLAVHLNGFDDGAPSTTKRTEALAVPMPLWVGTW